MAQPVIQPSFAAGELSPSLYARVDLAKFHVGAALLRNYFVDYRGGVSNRTGTRFVGEVADATQPSRLIPFQFSTVQAYVLVFSHLTMKVVMNGGFVIDHLTGREFVATMPYLGSELAQLKFTQSADTMTICHPNHTPSNLTRTAHDAWSLNPIAFGPGSPPPTGLTVTPALAAGTTQYAYQVTAIGSNGVTESVGSVAGVTTVARPMSTTAGEFMVLAWNPVPGAVLYNVYRQPEVPDAAAAAGQLYGFVGSTTSESFVDSNINPDFSRTPPQFGNTFVSSGAGSLVSLNVTSGSGYITSIPTAAVSGGGGSGAAVTLRLTGVRVASVSNALGGNYTPGDVVTLSGGVFVRPMKIRIPAVTQGSGAVDPFTPVQVVDGGEYTTLPTPNAFGYYPVTGGTGTGFGVVPTWGLGPYTITAQGSGYTTTPTVTVTGTLGSGGIAGSIAAVLSQPVNSNPTCAAYFQQRLVFAAPPNAPETFWMSKSGDYNNFGFSSPERPDDMISGTIASREVNAIRHLIPMNSLVAFSSGGAWKIDAGTQGGPVTPSTIQATPQAFNGCSDVPPIVVNYDVLYVQDKGSIVRDLAYNFYVNVYTGADMTALSNHLFFGHTIREWCWAEEPFKIVWAIRDDGVLLSFTYLKEQEVYGWAHHDTDGLFLSTCSISEAGENTVYFIVQRTVMGAQKMYVERLASRNMQAIPERGVPANLALAWFVDCGLARALTFPNCIATPDATTALPSLWSVAIIMGGSGYTAPTVNVVDATGTGATVTVTVVAGVITAVNVVTPGNNYTAPMLEVVDASGTGAVLHPVLARVVNIFVSSVPAGFTPKAGDIVRVNNGYGRALTGFNGNPLGRFASFPIDVIEPLTSTAASASGQWSCTSPVTSVTGLDHLEGKTVAILADGNVHPPQKVVGGRIPLQVAASSVVVGLPYVADGQSLYLDIPGESPTVQGKRKKITALTMRVQDSRGLKVGRDFTDLQPFKERAAQTMGTPIFPITGDERALIPSDWGIASQVCWRQDQPLPSTVLGMIPEVEVGDTPQ